MTDTIIVLITATDEKEAETLALRLVADRLAACANIVPGIKSVFRWKNKLETEDETLLIVKSTAARLPGIITTVKQVHSYEVPEIIALPVIGGNEDYINWVTNETS